MLEVIKNAVWNPVTVINLALIGAVILFKTRFYTIIRLPRILKETIFSAAKDRKAFGLMCTSLGGTIGVGNAVGVAGAIVEGGAGAVFWMAVAGFLGMAIKYAEVYFSLLYKPSDGHGGPLQYIEKGIGSKTAAYVYAFLCLGVSFGMGNLSQVRSALVSFDGIASMPKYALSLIIAVIFLYVSMGGLEKISKFSQAAIPFISLFYIILLSIILIKQREYIPEAMEGIISGSGIITGFKWALIKKGMTGGFSKSIFSSEAGLGSAGFAHGASDCPPHLQARWAVVEVFVDSLICIMTALALLSFPISFEEAAQAIMTKTVFALNFGKLGEIFYGASMMIFAFSSLICWYYNGSCALSYISKSSRLSYFYCMCFAIIVFLAGFISDSIIVELSDIANALMMLMNIGALWVLIFKNSLTF